MSAGPRTPPSAGARRAVRRTAAPLPRLLRSELSLALARPRTPVALAATLALPLGAALALVGEPDDVRNTLVLLSVTLSEPAAFFLAIPVVLVAADTFASERTRGTLDGLRMSPVGPGRLVVLKASAVLGAAVASAVVAVTGALLAGSVALGTGPYGGGAVLGRALALVPWTAVQLSGIGMLLMALSAAVRRPVVVVVTGFAALVAAPAIGMAWPSAGPVLPVGRWNEALTALNGVPAETAMLWGTTLRAAGFAVAGAGIAMFLLTRRED